MAWSVIGYCRDEDCDERLWHAGLSTDGQRCLVTGFDDCTYIVWDIQKQQVIWRDDGSDGNSQLPPLDEWIDESGYVELTDGSVAGRYRIFGLNVSFPKTSSRALGQSLVVDLEAKQLVIINDLTNSVISRLPYEWFSGDWAFASFSDNDKVIALIEPYNVTFCGNVA